MEFDQKLIRFVEKKYADEIAINDALSNVENIIIRYFKSLEEKLKEEISTSDGKIKFDYNMENDEIAKVTMDDFYLSFIKKDKIIEVIISDYTKRPYNTIKAKKSKEYLQKYEYFGSGDSIVDDGLLNSYLEKAFESLIG